MPTPSPDSLAGHKLTFDARGRLESWGSWRDILALEMNFYQECPMERGYPRFIYTTFLDAQWNPLIDRTDSIPATQNGMGIISYLKFFEFDDKRDPRYLNTARLMGDYLVQQTLTPDSGRYPRFTRSTGRRDQFPLLADAGCQGDRPHEIEPDKGGVAGHALMLLFAATGVQIYLTQALHNARVLAANQDDGDRARSPWPFRADYRTGEPRGPVSGNMTYILRLYDALLARGYQEFQSPRDALWSWIEKFQIPSAAGDGNLFAQFFEDHETPSNRTAWAPLNLARYLLEQRSSLHSEWCAKAGTLLRFVQKNFTHQEFNVTVCHEQDEDKEAWGGINSTYGAVLALYSRAIASESLADTARQALNFTLYSVDACGRPRDLHKSDAPGGWQEDAHTDVIHNFIDAMTVFPEWADLPATRSQPRSDIRASGSECG
jgi:hypothetical protein